MFGAEKCAPVPNHIKFIYKTSIVHLLKKGEVYRHEVTNIYSLRYELTKLTNNKLYQRNSHAGNNNR